jgi:hypothetical protein
MSSQLLLFLVEGQNFVLPLPVVQRVVGAVAIAGVPHAPRGVSGIINVHGNVMHVLDVRMCLGLPMREVEPGDHFILCYFEGCSFVLAVDQVLGTVNDFSKPADDSSDVVPCDARAAAPQVETEPDAMAPLPHLPHRCFGAPHTINGQIVFVCCAAGFVEVLNGMHPEPLAVQRECSEERHPAPAFVGAAQ